MSWAYRAVLCHLLKLQTRSCRWLMISQDPDGWILEVNQMAKCLPGKQDSPRRRLWEAGTAAMRSRDWHIYPLRSRTSAANLHQLALTWQLNPCSSLENPKEGFHVWVSCDGWRAFAAFTEAILCRERMSWGFTWPSQCITFVCCNGHC